MLNDTNIKSTDASFISVVAEECNSDSAATIYYSKKALENTAKFVINAFSPLACFQLSYAVKANRFLPILKLFSNLGLSASISSIAELELSLKAGFKEIYATNPGFSRADLRCIMESGATIDIDNLHQLNAFGEEFPGHNFGIRLRLDPPSSCLGSEWKGAKSRFGIAINAPDLVAISNKYNITATRILVHLGDIDNEKQALWLARSAIEFALNINSIQEINLGGGWYPEFFGYKKLSSFVDQLREVLTESQRISRRNFRFVIEPGAYLVRTSGLLKTTVTSVDFHEEYRAYQAVVNCSAWNLLHWANPKATIISNYSSREAAVRIVGATCEESDIFIEAQILPIPFEGDIVMLSDVGAYSTSVMRSLHGLLPPRELLIDA